MLPLPMSSWQWAFLLLRRVAAAFAVRHSSTENDSVCKGFALMAMVWKRPEIEGIWKL